MPWPSLRDAAAPMLRASHLSSRGRAPNVTNKHKHLLSCSSLLLSETLLMAEDALGCATDAAWSASRRRQGWWRHYQLPQDNHKTDLRRSRRRRLALQVLPPLNPVADQILHLRLLLPSNPVTATCCTQLHPQSHHSLSVSAHKNSSTGWRSQHTDN